MKMIIRVLIMVSALLISWGVKAHQPDLSSTLLVEQSDNKWVLQIRAALTAFEYEIEQHYGKDSYASPEAFQELVINYVQENTSIKFNNTNDVVLQNGMVKLAHETSVTFEVMGTPETIQTLAVKNSSFGDISRNQSALIVIKKGFSKDQFILDNDNEHTVQLKVSNSRFELVTSTQWMTQYPLLTVAVAVLGLSIIYFAFKNRQATVLNHAPLNA